MSLHIHVCMRVIVVGHVQCITGSSYWLSYYLPLTFRRFVHQYNDRDSTVEKKLIYRRRGTVLSLACFRTSPMPLSISWSVTEFRTLSRTLSLTQVYTTVSLKARLSDLRLVMLKLHITSVANSCRIMRRQTSLHVVPPTSASCFA